MGDALHQLVYVSTAVEPFSKRDLEELVAGSRARNEAHGITGCLLHRRGNFLQLVEGQKDDVASLYERLFEDRRHRCMTRLLEGAAEARCFGGAPLCYHDLDMASGLDFPGLAEFRGHSLSEEEFDEDPGRAYKLLMVFRPRVAPGQRA